MARKISDEEPQQEAPPAGEVEPARRFDEVRWEKEAAQAKRARERYRAELSSPVPDDLEAQRKALERLLSMACESAGNLRLYPNVQYDLRQRATMLLDRILDETLPAYRRNAFIPSGDEVDALVREAEAVLFPLTPTTAIMEETKRAGEKLPMNEIPAERFIAKQRWLVELWVERSMPLSATDKETSKALQRCLEVADEARRKGSKKTDALEMVAAVLGSTPGVVKKARAERSENPATYGTSGQAKVDGRHLFETRKSKNWT